MKRGQSRFPPVQFRLRAEDVLREASETQMLKAEVIDQGAFTSVMDDYQENLQIRSRMYEESQQQNQYDDEEEDEAATDPYALPSSEESKEPSTRAVRGYIKDKIFVEHQARRYPGILSGKRT